QPVARDAVARLFFTQARVRGQPAGDGETMKAIQLTNDPDFRAQVAEIDEKALPAGDVVVRIEHSTINYKDALAIGNASPIVRQWPMVPGIDFAGVVESSQHALWKPGDNVILNGWGVGESHWGGLAPKARVTGGWLGRA